MALIETLLGGEAPATAHRATKAADFVAGALRARRLDVRRVQPPRLSDARRVFPTVGVPCMPDPIRRTAYHEAGHVVMTEHFGLVPTFARIDVTDEGVSGQMDFERAHQVPEDHQVRPEAALAAASIHHAGLAAEFLLTGFDPGDKLHIRFSSSDAASARAILHPVFGHSSGAHWHAQRYAMHALSEAWERVETIANHLLEHHQWQPSS